ncbi:MAG: phytoene/squalene synthase family protein [Rhodocyclaceae bacterium]|nr:MAG: phytoene/squalene synthase family protein [Rhodocyclaceae bacterium]
MKAGPAQNQAAGRDQLVNHAGAAIRQGSKSFAAASRLFDRTTRERAWLLYAWCRRCDDLIDQQDHGRKRSGAIDPAVPVATIRQRTAQGLAGDATGDPAFDGFGLVARECGISTAMAEDVIGGFALDSAGWCPRTEADLMRYCFHVAGSVGVMMALVMGVSPDDGETLDRACDLGLAFQLANIARDLLEDHAMQRCYLPAEWLAEADIPPGEAMKPHYRAQLLPVVARLCTLQAGYDAASRSGTARLPFRCRWAVLSATGIYGAIARGVEQAGAQAWDRRIATTDGEKTRHVLRAGWQALINRQPAASAPAALIGRRTLMAMARTPA